MKESRSLQRDFNGAIMNLTIIPYTDAYFIAVGSRGLLGLMHESVCTNQAVSPITHRVLLGDRDDLATPIYCEKLAKRVMGQARKQRVIISCSVGKDVLMKPEVSMELTSWILQSL